MTPGELRLPSDHNNSNSKNNSASIVC